MKRAAFPWLLVFGVLSAGISIAEAADGFQPQTREFLMHTKDSTASAPACVLVRQQFVAVEQFAGENGSVLSLPRIRSDFTSSSCSEKAFPYEENPGVDANTRVTSTTAPWHKL
ncbi:hypothetical protein [Pseudomonas sp.]|uniref:hypothetical protein n=1 Tax=Pseudomonas sp. TaxID=306 RepID=UPI002908C31D|nr:hypothetical protein [Pseudomonas sp.]MDU4254521.1 hypothetical protein [Pseudomonas sp.]